MKTKTKAEKVVHVSVRHMDLHVHANGEVHFTHEDGGSRDDDTVIATRAQVMQIAEAAAYLKDVQTFLAKVKMPPRITYTDEIGFVDGDDNNVGSMDDIRLQIGCQYVDLADIEKVAAIVKKQNSK